MDHFPGPSHFWTNDRAIRPDITSAYVDALFIDHGAASGGAGQGCGSATRFCDCSTKRKIIKSLLSPGHVAARRSRRLPPVLNQAKHRNCALSATRNVGPLF